MGIRKTTEILYIMFPLKSLLSAIKIIFISDMLWHVVCVMVATIGSGARLSGSPT